MGIIVITALPSSPLLGPRFQGFKSLTSGHILHVARVHLNRLIAYQTALADALAVAAAEGEEARRIERLRIFRVRADGLEDAT